MAKENNEWNDWIGELFTPSYDVTVEDMLDRPQDKETTIKSKVKLVSALDPDTIKDAFERVRVTCVLAEEMRKKAAKQESSKGIQKEGKGLYRMITVYLGYPQSARKLKINPVHQL